MRWGFKWHFSRRKRGRLTAASGVDATVGQKALFDHLPHLTVSMQIHSSFLLLEIRLRVRVRFFQGFFLPFNGKMKAEIPMPNSKSGCVQHGKSFPDPANFAPAFNHSGEHRGTLSMAASRLPEVGPSVCRLLFTPQQGTCNEMRHYQIFTQRDIDKSIKQELIAQEKVSTFIWLRKCLLRDKNRKTRKCFVPTWMTTNCGKTHPADHMAAAHTSNMTIVISNAGWNEISIAHWTGAAAFRRQLFFHLGIFECAWITKPATQMTRSGACCYDDDAIILVFLIRFGGGKTRFVACTQQQQKRGG